MATKWILIICFALIVIQELQLIGVYREFAKVETVVSALIQDKLNITIKEMHDKSADNEDDEDEDE